MIPLRLKFLRQYNQCWCFRSSHSSLNMDLVLHTFLLVTCYFNMFGRRLFATLGSGGCSSVVVNSVIPMSLFHSSSFTCGLAGALASNPVDVVRTRMMNQRVLRDGRCSGYTGTLDCLLQVRCSSVNSFHSSLASTLPSEDFLTMI